MHPDVLNRLLSAVRAALIQGLRGAPVMAIAIEVIPSCSSNECAKGGYPPYIEAGNAPGAGGQISSGGTDGSVGGAGGQTAGGSGASADASLDGPPSDASHFDGSKPTDSSTPTDSSRSLDSSASSDSAADGPG